MKKNTIKVRKIKNPDFDDLIQQIFIDNISLDIFFNNEVKHFDTINFIPTFSSEIGSVDRGFFWDMVAKNVEKKMILPILKCNDPYLDCLEHLIFAEIEYKSDFVSWNKIGVLKKEKYQWKETKKNIYKLKLDNSDMNFYDFLENLDDSCMNWFDSFSFNFDKKDYDEIIDIYRKENQGQEIIDEIKDWLCIFPKKNFRKYVYLNINSQNDITFKKSNNSNYNFSKKKSFLEFDFKKIKTLKLSECPFDSKKLIELTKKAIEDINNYYGIESIINFCEETIICDESNIYYKIKTKNMER
ncbi:hypothetical protein [Aureivirga sp. CE67]|uniref:hypothetical protein n=1 Tax=Aureivirga sp. CE67 TaxID=1788983 RepID=UPI0018CBE246|nr:hypothetical protein [Aureivirga sp. CE67]